VEFQKKKRAKGGVSILVKRYIRDTLQPGRQLMKT